VLEKAVEQKSHGMRHYRLSRHLSQLQIKKEFRKDQARIYSAPFFILLDKCVHRKLSFIVPENENPELGLSPQRMLSPVRHCLCRALLFRLFDCALNALTHYAFSVVQPIGAEFLSRVSLQLF
jgi:hypothetical protein